MIWLASYPKSGNTWLRMLIANLHAQDDKPIDINDPPECILHACERRPFEELLLLDTSLLTHDEIDCLRPRLYEQLAHAGCDEDAKTGAAVPARFMLVHDAYGPAPNGEPLLAGRRAAAGAILIVRDPRDVAPSLANYFGVSVDIAIALLNDKRREANIKAGRLHRLFRQRPRGWSEHAQSWLDQTDIPVHVVRYEDMKADAIGTFAAALGFAKVLASDEQLQRAVAFADFSELRRQEQDKGFSEMGSRPDRLFFRRGEAGAWRDELTTEQVARIEAAHAPMMERLGYELAGMSARGKRRMASDG